MIVVLFVRDTYLSESEFADVIDGLLLHKIVNVDYIPKIMNDYLSKLWFKMESVEFISDFGSVGQIDKVLDIKINMEF